MNHHLTGLILRKEAYKVYNKKSIFCGNSYWKLLILLDNKAEQTIFVYPNLVALTIQQAIENSHYIDKRYLFFCQKKSRRWILTNWRELPYLGASPPNLKPSHHE